MNNLEIKLKDLSIGKKLHFRCKDYKIDFSEHKFQIEFNNGNLHSVNVQDKVGSQPQKSVFEISVSSETLNLVLHADFDLSLIEILEVDEINVNRIVYPI